MNWDKVFGLDAKSLHQTINGLFWLFILYCFIMISASYTKANEIVIPIDYKLSMAKQGTWKNAAHEPYKITTSKYGQFELSIDTKGHPKELIISKLSELLYLFLLGFIFLQVKGLSSSIKNDSPFEKMNIKRLRRIGFTLVILGFIYPLLNWYLASFAKDQILIDGLELKSRIKFDWTYYFLGLVFLIIARVFKKGIELREENALTI